MTNLKANLFIATGCTHCPVVMGELNELLKKGQLASLNTVNIAVDNSRASELGIRSVPWFSFQDEHTSMVFSGKYSPAEINAWVNTGNTEKAMQIYIEKSLEEGHLAFVTQAITIVPQSFETVIQMLKDEDTSMHVRIGLDALIESLTETDILDQAAPEFMAIANSGNLRLQIDALHYLALTGNSAHKAFLQEKTNDPDPQLRAAAIEAIETLDDLVAA